MRTFLRSMKKYRVLWIFSIFMLVLAVVSVQTGNSRTKLVYADSLDEVVATVGEEEITLRDFAVYVAHQEAEVQKQALVYDPQNPKAYWGLHTNGKFIKLAAREAAAAQAVHDELFYQLSQEMDMDFSEEEEACIENDIMDFWYDLTDRDGQEALGISEKDVRDAMYRIARAQKYQAIRAQMDGVEYEAYEYGAEEYQEFLSEYEYSIDEEILERIDFGNVTLK